MELQSVTVAQILAHKGRDIHTIRPGADATALHLDPQPVPAVRTDVGARLELPGALLPEPAEGPVGVGEVLNGPLVAGFGRPPNVTRSSSSTRSARRPAASSGRVVTDLMAQPSGRNVRSWVNTGDLLRSVGAIADTTRGARFGGPSRRRPR